MTDKINAAKAVLAALGLTPNDLLSEPESPAPTPDIDTLLPRKRWVPAGNEGYHYISAYGTSEGDEWDGEGLVKHLLQMGNVFRSSEAAEEHAANIRAWVELRERSDHPMKAITGYFIKVTGVENWHLPGVRFSTPALRDAAVAHIGKDRIDKLIRWIWGV